MPKGKWAYTLAERRKIMDCIQRLNAQEAKALDGAMFKADWSIHPPYVREQLRGWFRQRWTYLINEYERLP